MLKEYVLPASLCAVVLAAGLYAHAQGYTSWQSTDGNQQIEYRWQTYGGGATVPKCNIQLRNLNGDDHKQYNLEIDYTDPQGKDETFHSYVQWVGDTTIENAGIYACTQVSGAMT